MEEATGEMLDVIQDNDPDLPPEADLPEPDDSSERRWRRGPAGSGPHAVRQLVLRPVAEPVPDPGEAAKLAHVSLFGP